MKEEMDYLELKYFYNKNDLGFDTTSDVLPMFGVLGQEDAISSFELGISINEPFYNLCVVGESGIGKMLFAKNFIEKQALNKDVPYDLCYVYNFKEPNYPRFLYIKAGEAKVLKEDMEELVMLLKKELTEVYSSSNFEDKKNSIIKIFKGKRDKIIKQITEEAKEQNFGVKSTNTGIYFMPIVNDAMISEDQYDELPEDEKIDIAKNSENIQKKAAVAMSRIKEYEKTTQKSVNDLEYSEGLFIIGYHINNMVIKYKDNKEITGYLLEVKEDILNNLENFVEDQLQDIDDESLSSIAPWILNKSSDNIFSRYNINIIVNNENLKGAPVIVSYNPTYTNLLGEIDYDNEYGNLTTDFMKIKGGLLHRANGGYIILRMQDVISNIGAWELLKRVILTGDLTIEPQKDYVTSGSISTIKPQTVPVKVKIILIGSDYFYGALTYDDDLKKLFKMYVYFKYEIDLNKRNINSFVSLIKNFIDERGMVNFDVTAVGRLIEYSTRLSENRNKLSSNFEKISEILIESHAFARLEELDIVLEKHVIKAINEKEKRFSNYEIKLHELIRKNILMLQTRGFSIGQVNALSVISMDDYSFAIPSKITATCFVGKAGVIDIDKECDMSGSIHNKGVQVIDGYIGQTYAQKFPLSLSCKLCFEQNYEGIDGDSASSSETYAILSALSGYPINNEIAVTGSMNQKGDIQPVGGVTYKIEGFYNICKTQGLTGTQGVIIPVQNRDELVLKDEVVEAVKQGMFHIYPISHIDEGVEILMGVKAGTLLEDGTFTVNSVHNKVASKLKYFYDCSNL